MDHQELVRAALRQRPRWHVIHWGTPGTSTLLCLWVAGREAIVAVDGMFVTHDGVRREILDDGLTDVLRQVEQSRDAAVLGTLSAAQTQLWLLRRWQETCTGVWNFPRGGYVRWANNGALHVEVSDGRADEQPLPKPLQDVLVDLGWNPPDSTSRNCWLKSDRPESVAALCVLTPLAAFGYESPPSF